MFSVMKAKYWLLVLALVMFGAFPGKGMAVPISILNPSFEDHNPLTGGSRGLWNKSIVDWQTTGGLSGTYQPSTPGNTFGEDVFSVDVPAGLNTAYSMDETIYQVLGDSLTADTMYTLRVDVGDRFAYNLPSHSIQLRAGVHTLGSAGVIPADGNFAEASLTYTANVGDPGIGELLGIWLVNSGGGKGYQVNWDNVRLTAAGSQFGETSSIPEPDTIALLGIGLAGLAGAEVRRKRKKNAVDKS